MIKQREKESLRAYVKHFNRAILEVDEANDQVQLTAFQTCLMTKDFIFSLAKTPPTTMIDLLFKAQKYINGEEALMVKGIDGKWKMEEIDESKAIRLKSIRKITSTTKNYQYESKPCDQTRKIKTNEQNHINDPILKKRIKLYDWSHKNI